MSRSVQFVLTVDANSAVVNVQKFNATLASTGTTANTAANATVTSFNRVEMMLKKMQSAVIGFIGAFAFREVIRGFSEIVDAGLLFESSFTGIRKVVEGTEQQFGLLSASMRQLAKDIPIGVNELNKIGEIAGTLGVPVQKIKGFTETIAKIGLVSELTTEEAATNFARFSTIMGLPIENVKTLASTVVRLGMDTAANEQEILAFSMNIGAAGRQVGLTADQVIALSATLASTGLHAEKAGSQISTILKKMDIAVDEGGQSLQEFAKVAGVAVPQSVDEFSKKFKTNAAQALVEFVSGLNAVNDAGGNLTGVLKELDMKNIRIQDVAVRTALAHNLLAESMKTAADEARKSGDALENAVTKRLGTARVELDKVWARLNDVAITVSSKVLPSIVDLAKGLADAVESTQKFTEENGNLIKAMVVLGATFAGFKLLAWVAGLASVKSMLGTLALAFTTAEGAALTFGRAVAALPLLAVGTIVVGLTMHILESLDAMEKAAEASKRANVEQNNTIIAQNKSIEQLSKFGVFIDRRTLSEAGLAKAIREGWVEVTKRNVADKEMLERANQLRIATDAETEAMKKRVAVIRESMDHTKGSNDMEQAIQQELKAGHAIATMLDDIGKKSLQYRDDMHAIGASVPSGISAVAAAYEQAQIAEIVSAWGTAHKSAAQEVNEADNKMIMDARNLSEKIAVELSNGKDFTSIMNKYGEAAAEFQKTMFDMGLGVDSTLSMIANSFNATALRVQMLGNALDGINLPKDLLDILPAVSTKDMVAAMYPQLNQDPNMYTTGPTGGTGATKQEKKDYEEMAKGLSRAFDKVFDQLVKKGKLVWKDLANFALEVFEPALNSLFAPLKKNLTDALQKPLGKLGDDMAGSITKHIGGPIGDAAGKLFGDKAGKILGNVAGGLASAGIGAAIGIGIQLLGKLLGKSGSEVNNNLTKNIQDPFTDTVGKMHDSFIALQKSGELTLNTAVASRAALSKMLEKFKEDAAAYAATGDKQALAVKNMFSTIEQYWGTDLSVIFKKLDDAIVSLGGEAAMTTDDLEALNANLVVLREFDDKVGSIMAQFQVNSQDVQALESSLMRLQNAGIPTDLILTELGGSITGMATALRNLNITIPPTIEYYDSLIRAQQAFNMNLAEQVEALNKAKSRLSEVNSELEQVKEALQQSLIQKLTLIESTLEKSASSIENWKKQVATLTEDITDLRTKLSDADYWQKRYTDSIKESQDALESLTEQRKGIEKQIADLMIQIEEDRLNAILKTSKNASIIKAAELQLARLQNKDTGDHIEQLAALRNLLPDIIRQETEAARVLEEKKILAATVVAVEKQQMQDSLTAKLAEKAATEANIDAEMRHVAELMIQQAAVIAQMAIFGAVRQSEIEKIDQTINSLIRRKDALEAERVAIEAFIAFITNNPIIGPVLGPLPSETIISDRNNRPEQRWTSPVAVQDPNYLGTADMGRTFTTGGYVMVQPGETINHSSKSGAGISIGNVEVSISVNGNNGAVAGREAAEAFISTLEKEGNLRRRAQRALK